MQRSSALVSTAFLVLVAAGSAGGFTITPTYVDAAGQTWDATKRAVVERAIGDWTTHIAFANGNTQNIPMTFTFVSSASYAGQWSGSFSAFPGTSVFPYHATHTVQMNAGLMTGGPTTLAFTLNEPTFNQWDALTVLRHEIGHALGFTTLYKTNFINSPNDKWSDRITISGSSAVFDPAGLNVPLVSSTNTSHILDSGRFAGDLMVPSTPNGVRRMISKTDLNMLELAYGYTLLTQDGDADLDGDVDTDDYLLIDRRYTGGYITWERGDFDENGLIDAADYALINASFGQNGPSSLPAELVAAPEPGTLGLLAAGAAGLLRRRRRR